MTWGAGAAGAIQSLSNIGAAGATFHMQRQAQQWAKRMHATHYQRTMKDMRAAGLNPMLAMKMGAPVPGSSHGTASGAGVGAAMAAGSQAVTAERTGRVQRAQTAQQTSNLVAQYKNIEKMGREIDARTIKEQLNAGVFAAQIPKEVASAGAQRSLGYMLEQQGNLAGWNARLAELGIPKMEAENELLRNNPWLRKIGLTLEQLAPLLNLSGRALERMLRRGGHTPSTYNPLPKGKPGLGGYGR